MNNVYVRTIRTGYDAVTMTPYGKCEIDYRVGEGWLPEVINPYEVYNSSERYRVSFNHIQIGVRYDDTFLVVEEASVPWKDL